MKILLAGKMGAGKDTVAYRLCINHKFQKIGFADEVKAIGRKLFPEAFREIAKPRALLQSLGTKMREINPDCWTNFTLEQASQKLGNVVISDCRYRNELDLAVKTGFIPVLITCPDEIRLQRLAKRDGMVDKETFYHQSETDLDSTNFKYILNNGGSREFLEIQIDKLVKWLTPDCKNCGRTDDCDSDQARECMPRGRCYWVMKEGN